MPSKKIALSDTFTKYVSRLTCGPLLRLACSTHRVDVNLLSYYQIQT